VTAEHPSSSEHRSRVIAAFLTIYVVWGSTYLAIAFAIRTIPPFLMAGTRLTIAGALLYLWSRWRGGARPRPAQWGWAVLLGALFFLIGNGTVVWVEQRLPSGLTALVVALVSVWTALLEWLRPGGARPPRIVFAGIVLGFLGVTVLVVPGGLGGGRVDVTGVVLLTGSTFAWALASVISRYADLPAGAGMVSGMELFTGGVQLLIASLVTREWRGYDPATITLQSALALLYLIVFGSLVTFTAFSWLLQVSTPNKVSTAGYVNPMVALLVGWALGGESLGLRSLVASVIIVGSVILIITGRELGTSRARRLPAPAQAPSR